jgi:selenide, water dikinase
LGPEDLKIVLSKMPKEVDSRLLVGFETGDDAAVFKLREDLAVVQSLDFFMPIVDDPFVFGQIAAANALSDIYAMGATPIMALAILGFPIKKLSPEIASLIMKGGTDICHRAGIQIVGGHSIDDAEPKFGLSVTGITHPDKLWTNSSAEEGDLLVLTKPLGIGAMGSANKKGLLTSRQYEIFVETTTTLNDIPAKVAHQIGVTAATDVTGFGLLGHSLEMANGAGLKIELWSKKVPIIPGALELIEQGIRPGATQRNLNFVENRVLYAPTISDALKAVLADPQTSGGLLFAIPPNKAEKFCAELKKEKALEYSIIGQFKSGSGIDVQ